MDEASFKQLFDVFKRAVGLSDAGPTVPCERCAAKETRYMTECCRRPICSDCEQDSKLDGLGRKYAPPGHSNGRKLGSTYDFVCPFCGVKKFVRNYDSDSLALAYAKMDGYEDPVLVVPIEKPPQTGSATQSVSTNGGLLPPEAP